VSENRDSLKKGLAAPERIERWRMGRFEKRFYLALSYEERGHALKLMDSIEYLTDPASCIYLRDGRSLEG